MALTSGSHDFEVQAIDGTWIGLSLATTFDKDGNALPKSFQDVMAASDADAPFSEALESDVQESWFRGVGLDLDWSPGVDTRDPDYACPAGAATDVPLPPGGAGQLVAVAEYGGDIWFAQIGDGNANTGRVIRLVSGLAPATVSISFGAGRYCRGLVVADNGSNSARLYAMVSDGGVATGAMYAWDGSTWTAAVTFGTNGRSRAKRVTWRGRDGIKNNALATISGPKTISYTKAGGNPMTPADWVEGVPIATAYELIDITGARGHIFLSADDNLFDIDEVGNTPGITSFIEEQVQPGNGDSVLYLDGSVYYAMGRGLLKINVDQDGVIQEQPGQCAPGAFLPVEGCPRGYITAMCPDQSWLVAAVFDTTTRRSAVFWGKPREQLGIESPNPMIWHGPLLLIEFDYKVTRMRTSALAGDLRLWVASIGDNTGTPRLSWMSLPLAGTTIQDQVALGLHRVTNGAAGGTLQPYARMYGLKKTAGDKASRKDLHAHVIGSRGLEPGAPTRLGIYNRADPIPGDTNWGAVTYVTAGPVQTLTPTSITTGYATQQRIDFFAPNGGSTPPLIPYLDSIRNTYWRVAPDTQVRTLEVVYGDGVLGRSNSRDDVASPDWITAQLEALIDAGTRTTVRDPNDNRWTVRFRQSFPREITLGTGGPYHKQVKAGLQMVLLGAAA